MPNLKSYSTDDASLNNSNLGPGFTTELNISGIHFQMKFLCLQGTNLSSFDSINSFGFPIGLNCSAPGQVQMCRSF